MQLALTDLRSPWPLTVNFLANGIRHSAIFEWRPLAPGGDGWSLALRAPEGGLTLAPRRLRSGLDFWAPFRAFFLAKYGAHLRLDVLGEPAASAGLRVQCSITLSIDEPAPGQPVSTGGLGLSLDVR